MIRDPNFKQSDNITPVCFGNYQEDHTICANKCHKVLSCKSFTDEDDKRREGKEFKNSNGVPLCFGELYSSISVECQEECIDVSDCFITTEENNVNKPKISATAKRSDKLHMFQSFPRTQPPPPLQYNSSPSSYYTSSNSYSQTQSPYYVDERMHNYTKEKYGVGLRYDPIIPGQFEGEPWYERFFKEIAKYTAYYALKLLGDVVVNSRWAPTVEGQKE